MAEEYHDPKKLIAGLDAIIDEAVDLSGDVDRENLEEPVAQALDLLLAAQAAVGKLMVAMGIFDPDAPPDQNSELSLLDGATDRQYVIRFSYRSDGGPYLVGSFPTRDAAREYLHTLEPFEADWEVWPVTEPHVRV